MNGRYVTLNNKFDTDFITPAMTAKERDRAYYNNAFDQLTKGLSGFGKAGQMLSTAYNTDDKSLLNDELSEEGDADIQKKIDELFKQYSAIDLKMREMGEAPSANFQEFQWDGIESPTMSKAQQLAFLQRLGARSGLYSV